MPAVQVYHSIFSSSFSLLVCFSRLALYLIANKDRKRKDAKTLNEIKTKERNKLIKTGNERKEKIPIKTQNLCFVISFY